MFKSLAFSMALVAGSVFAGEMQSVVENAPEDIVVVDNAPAPDAVVVNNVRVREVKRCIVIPTIPYVTLGPACAPPTYACEPVAPACDPVIPACAPPVGPCCRPIVVVRPSIKIERTVHIERHRDCIKKTVEKQYKLMSGCACDPCDPCCD